MRLLRFLITGDWHLCKYETIKTVLIRYTTDWGDKHVCGERYVLKCNECGKMKVFNTYEE